MEESKNELDELEKNETEEHEYTTTYKLNSYGIDFDVNGLVRRQNSHSIYLPDFQRNYVWSKKKASKFIESLLLGLPIPSVCLYKEEDNKQIIIDGFQRLESIRLFYSKKFSDGSKFALVSVNSLFEGKTIEDLDEELRLKLDDTLIHATVVKADEPQEQNYNAVYLIFERLNTGGVNLTPQEIRSCVYHGSFQKIIQNLVEDENFKKVLIVSSKRKKDQEIVIRLLSLADSYEEYTGNMKEFLNQYCDINKNKSEADCSVQVNLFNQTFSFLSQLDSNIFRPSKVMPDKKRGIKGNNRNTEEFKRVYSEQMETWDANFFFGYGSDALEKKLSTSGGNASATVYIFEFGVFGLFLLLFFYGSIIYLQPSNIGIGYLFLFAVSFLQRPYALWFSQIVLMYCGCSKFVEKKEK